MNLPSSLALDADGALYVADTGNFTVRRVADPRGAAVVATVAGTPLATGYVDGPGAAARFGQITGLGYARTATGNALFVVDSSAQLVRKIGCPPAARIADGSFEQPVLPARSFLYTPANGGWRFSGGAGVQANGSTWRAAWAVDGVQTAFLQNFGARIAQTVDLIEGRYVVSFHAARRAGQIQPILVAVNGVPLGTPITPAGDGFQLYTTPPIDLVAGSHTLEFRSVGGGPDNSSFIDAVVLDRQGTTIVPTRYGLTFGVSANTALPPGVVEMSCHAPGAALDNPHRGSCNPYQGDMSCKTALPVLCRDPVTGAMAATTRLVVGSTLADFVSGVDECQTSAPLPGPSQMARFHDGGGWRIQGPRGAGLVPGQRYWVYIEDQPANCGD